MRTKRPVTAATENSNPKREKRRKETRVEANKLREAETPAMP